MVELAAVASPGENVADASNTALSAAFYEALNNASNLAQLPSESDEPLAGRLDLDDYPVSPRGTPTQATGCGVDTDILLAVPIPPAAMDSRTDDPSVGWCEGTVRFGADLTQKQATILDYSTLAAETVLYNGWGRGCDALHCNDLFTGGGVQGAESCTVLAVCDGEGNAVVTGYAW